MSRSLAIVTGTSSGIGLALADRFLSEGWSVMSVARRETPIQSESLVHTRADLSEAEDLRRFIDDIVVPAVGDQDYERVALVNNAATVGALAWLREFRADALGALLALNVTAPVILMASLAKHVPATTPLRIVNVSSGAAHTAYLGLADYCASKSALRMAGQTLAIEFEEEKTTPARRAVFSYEPGLVETNMQQSARAASPDEFPSHDAFQGFADEGRVVAPDRVVAPIVDWCSGDPERYFTEARFEG